MIFVTLGTQDKSFERLLKMIDEEIINGNIKEEVIVQAGYTNYKTNNMEVFDYISNKKFNQLINKCNLLITHGGVGNILTGLKNKKKVIAVPRLMKYGEHTNDHQLEIVNTFYEKGYILKVDETNDLIKVLKETKNFIPIKWEFNNEKIIKNLKEYIDKN